MNLPYKKCKCCGKRIGLKEWWKTLKEMSVKAAQISTKENISCKQAVKKLYEKSSA